MRGSVEKNVCSLMRMKVHAMKLLVDGYNVLKSFIWKKHITQDERRGFINQLVEYSHEKNLKITVVFDGGPFYYSSQEKVNGLTVVYSGTQDTADEYIKRHLQECNNTNILLITSDRELIDYAAGLSIDALGGGTFYSFMKDALDSKKQVNQKKVQETALKKLVSGEANEELDELMTQGSQTMMYKENDRSQERESKRSKPSKKERNLQRKIKKLM